MHSNNNQIRFLVFKYRQKQWIVEMLYFFVKLILPCFLLSFRTADTAQNNNHELVTKTMSAPETGNERFLVTNKNGEECEKRSLQSKQRIEDIRKKYKLKDRDYNARSCVVWTEQDEKEKKKEREQRRTLREQIRFKYNLPAPQCRRTSMVASG